MAKNNGNKFIFLLIICVLAVAVILVMGGDKSGATSKTKNFESITTSETTQNSLQDNKNNSQCSKSVCDVSAGQTYSDIELLCLMYHNVVDDNQKQGDYEIRVSALENDFIELKKLGYQCVNSSKLIDIVDNKKYGRYVMITFDDGFYGVYKHLPALLEKYDMFAMVSVVGEYMDWQDKQNYKTRCSYMNTKEVQELSKNSRIEIAYHSYNMHHIDDRRGVKIKPGESVTDYKNFFGNDTIKLKGKFNGLGITSTVYCYPYGEYCKESENLLKELNFNITMTCTEKINYLSDRQSLYLVGRINRAAKYKNLNNLLLKACNKH